MKKSAAKTAKAAAPRPEFVQQGERALRRAVLRAREERRALGMPLIGWKNGKIWLDYE